jgi:hypothetical protein
MSDTRLPNGLGDAGATLLAAVERRKGVGLPFATLIFSGVVSVAAFGIQMVQHAFEMRQANIENGFKFYFDNRTQLKERADTDKEMSLLKLIGNAFPNVYCDARQDTYERASSAEIGVIPVSSGPAPFGEADRKIIVSFLVAHDRPLSPQFATGIFSVMGAALFSKSGGGDPQPCDPLTGGAPVGDVKTALEEKPAPAAGAPAPAEPEKQASIDKDGVGKAANERAELGGLHVYRVFVHIGVSGTRHIRPLDIGDEFRDELAAEQFRVMQGVQLVDTHILPSRGEVRYFGPQEQAAAEKLAAYFTNRFKSEKIEFTAKPIGESFPYMNPDNIEVWIPDPGTVPQSKAPSKAG